MSGKKVQSEYTDAKDNDKDDYADSGCISEKNLSCEQYSDVMQDSGDQKDPREPTQASTARTVEDMCYDSGVISDNFSSLSIGGEQPNNLSSNQTNVDSVAPTIGKIPVPTVVVDDIEKEPPRPTFPTPLWQILFQQDDDGDNKLHLCAVHGSEAGVRAIISACPHRALLDVRNDDGHSPLHLAVHAGHARIVTILVASGANVCIRDCDGNTPLHLATLAGDVECLKALVADRKAHRHADALEQKNYEGETCVYLAARAGNVEILRILVQFGADINSREGKAGYTALHVAAERGDRQLATFLIRECESIAPHTRNYARRTALKLAGAKLCRAFASLRPDDDSSDTSDDYDDSDDSASDDEMQFSGNTYNPMRNGAETINVA